MTHTPGPWKKEGLKVIAGTRGTICVCPVVSLGGVFNVEANAHLIAAAPEMLEALKALLDIDNSPAGSSGHVDIEIEIAVKMGLAAIDKAESGE